jgi:hypothetical protein
MNAQRCGSLVGLMTLLDASIIGFFDGPRIDIATTKESSLCAFVATLGEC